MSEHCGNNNDPLDTLTGTMILDDVLGAVTETESDEV
jgi:DEAD/DEAH box helicase domain-containing protein